MIPTTINGATHFNAVMLNGLCWSLWGIYWIVMAFSASRAKVRESVMARLEHLIPLTAAFYLIFHTRPTKHGVVLSIVGNLATFAGLSFAIWARRHLGRYWSGLVTLKEGHKVIRTGPYALVRHPIYTGMIFAALGSAGIVVRWQALVGWLLLVVSFVQKLKREEKLLLTELGDEYASFQKDTPMLLPKIASLRAKP